MQATPRFFAAGIYSCVAIFLVPKDMACWQRCGSAFEVPPRCALEFRNTRTTQTMTMWLLSRVRCCQALVSNSTWRKLFRRDFALDDRQMERYAAELAEVVPVPMSLRAAARRTGRESEWKWLYASL